MNKFTILLTLFAIQLLNTSFATQVCATNVETFAPDSRYIFSTDNLTITDSYTGLMWKKCTEGLSGNNCSSGSPNLLNWQDAFNQALTANSVTFAGFNDWRLPNVKELLSLVEFSCATPSINSNIFPNTSTDEYWTSSPHHVFTSSATVIDFDDPSINIFSDPKDRTNYLRLVRNISVND